MPKAKRKIDSQIAELKDIIKDLIIDHENKIKHTDQLIKKYGITQGLEKCRKWDEAKVSAFEMSLSYINSLDS